MIEVRINGVAKWQVNEYTFNDPQMGLRSISLTVTHPSDNATVPSFVGAYVEYEGERYDIVNSKPTAEKGIDSINYKYNLIFSGQEAELQKRKIRNLATVGVDTFISQGTSFSLYADINQFKQLLENNLKYYFGSKWTINLGSTTSESVMVSVNNMFIWDLLLKTFEYYGLRWNITGNTINIGYTPDIIQHVFDYGYSGGLVKITRTAQSEPTINRLIGVGGSRNVPINYFTNRYSDFPVDPNPISGDVNIKNIMPKVFRDSVIAGTLPYIDYVEDAALVTADGVKEDALEPNEEIYPSIAGVEVAGLGRIDQIIAASVPTANTPDDAGYSPTFDIWVKDIGFDLADNQYTATQDAKISFTSGMLAGYEFVILATNGVRNVVVDTSKSYGGVSSKYKITLINSSEDFTATGRMLPNSAIKAMAGDSFVIYDIIMPQNYVELAELRVQNWLNEQLLIKKVEKPTYAIEPTDTFFEENIAPESDGKTIREKLKSGNKLTVNNTKVTDGAQELHINNITIQYGGLLPKYSFMVTDKVSVQGSAIARLTNEIQKTDNSVQDTDKKIVKLQQYSDRQWKEIQETITLLGAAIDGFSTGINPITVQTMQLLVGNESLQFRFVSSKTTPVAVSHAFNWDDVLKSFTATSGIIQHMTLGITEISLNHPVSAYKFWDIASYSNNTLVAEKPYYLYAKCSRTTSGAVFLLSDVPIGMYDDANYYYFLTGILNSENGDGGRSFVSLYGFTEILPGRITTDKIVSSDGLTYFDLLNGVIGGKIRFASTGGGETSLADWADGTAQDIQDAQSAANSAALAAQQAIDEAEANVTLINQETAKLQAQIDGEVSNWFYPYSPTLANYPASDWTTNAIKDRHIGDTFTSIAQAPATDAGKSWRFVKNGTVYSWTQISDSDAVLALQKAAQAQAAADGKSTTHLLQPIKYSLGDMWVLNADQTVNGTAYKQGEILTATQDSATFVQAHWVKKVRYTDDSAVNNMEIGSRNLLLNSGVPVTNSNYPTKVYNLSPIGQTLVDGEDVTVVIKGSLGAGKSSFRLYNSGGSVYAGATIYPSEFIDGIAIKTFKWIKGTASNTTIPVYPFSNTVTVDSTIEWIKLVRGNKTSRDWTEAQEDVQARIDAAKTEAENAAQAYADTKSEAERVLAEAYADGKVSAEEQARIDDVNAKLAAAKAHAEAQDALLKTQQEAYADGKISTAEQAAIDAAKDYADLKKTEAQAYADGIVSDEEARAIADALDKFNASKAHAEQLVKDIEIGVRNLILQSQARAEVTNGSAQNWVAPGYYLSEPLKIGQKYTFYCEGIEGTSINRLSFRNPGSDFDGVTGNKHTFTATAESTYLYLYLTDYSATYKIGGIKLVKGDKCDDWTEAPEDVEASILQAKQDAENASKAYADTKSEAERVLAEAYADGKVSAEEQARIDDVNAKLAAAKAHAEAQDALLKTQQEAYADGKISTAEQAAIDAAKDYADLKKTEAQAYADGIVSDEEARAIADALDKFNASKAHAEQLVNNLEIGGRNLIAKKYIKDWNLVNSSIVVQGSDAYGEYLGVNQGILYGAVGGSSALRDIFQGKISYNENTQYALKVRWKIAATQNYPGLMLRFNYSDGTYSGYISLNGSDTTLTEKSIISEVGKTVSGISCLYGDGANRSLIYDIQMTEGNKHTAGYLVAPEDVEANIATAKTEAEDAAKAYADTKAEAERVLAEAYADGKVSAEEQARIDDVNAKLAAAKAYAEAQDALLKTQQEAYADGKISTAEQAAIDAAKDYADLKKTEVQAYADGIVSDEEARAIADALAKFSASKAHAEQLVKDIEIGGRNYILNSLNRIGFISNDPTLYPIENQSVDGMDYRRFRRTYPEGVTQTILSTYTAEFFTPEKSGDYIYSAYFRPNDSDIELRVRFGNTYGEYTLCKAGEWTRVSVGAFINKGQNTRLFGVWGDMPQESVQWIDYNRVSVVSGNKPTDWTPAPEDVDKKISDVDIKAIEALAKANISKAITDKFGTTIDGGLINTVTVELREADTQDVTAFISGIQGALKNLPAFGAGGSYADALANLAKIIFRHDGSGQLAGGLIKWTEAGDLDIGNMEVDPSGALVIRDEEDTARLIITKDDVTPLADIGSSVQNTTINNTDLGFTYMLTGGIAYYTQGNKIPVYNNNTNLSVSTSISIDIYTGAGFKLSQARGRANVYLKKVGYSDKVLLGEAVVQVDKLSGEASTSMSGVIPLSKNMLVSAGMYEIVAEVWMQVTEGDDALYTLSGILGASVMKATFDAANRRTEIGKNGIGIIADAYNYLCVVKEGSTFKSVARTNGLFDMPGVLAAGSVSSDGVQANVWGAKSNPAGAGAISGGRSVPLANMKHDNYVVQITPHTATTFRVGTKTTSSFQAIGTGGFDYVVIGNNY